MTQEEYLDLFKKTGALLTGHFLLSSGLHSRHYFQCAKVLQYPNYAEQLCSQLATSFFERKPDAVIAPAVGGILVAHEVARALGVRAIFAEREHGEMTLRRGFELRKGEQVLVVEDVVTTGGSIREVLDLSRKLGGDPIGAACIVDRSGGSIDLDVEFVALVSLQIDTFAPDDCQLCKQELALVKPGSREYEKSSG